MDRKKFSLPELEALEHEISRRAQHKWEHDIASEMCKHLDFEFVQRMLRHPDKEAAGRRILKAMRQAGIRVFAEEVCFVASPYWHRQYRARYEVNP